MKLENKVAIVTGAGRGIGKAIALAYAREGAHLVLASRNNAAVQPPIGPLWENDPDEWLRTVLVNLGGVFLCCRAVVPVMMRQAGGEIINLSGGGAMSPRPYFTAYAASKAAVVRLTETLAEELREFNIRVNAVAPGAVSTTMTEEVLATAGAAGERALAEAGQVREDNRTAEAAMALALFLASNEADGLTGRVISAVWDDWRGARRRLGEILASDAWTLRRVPLPPETSPSLRHSFYEEDLGSATEDGYDLA